MLDLGFWGLLSFQALAVALVLEGYFEVRFTSLRGSLNLVIVGYEDPCAKGNGTYLWCCVLKWARIAASRVGFDHDIAAGRGVSNHVFGLRISPKYSSHLSCVDLILKIFLFMVPRTYFSQNCRFGFIYNFLAPPNNEETHK